MGPRTGLDEYGQEKTSRPLQGYKYHKGKLTLWRQTLRKRRGIASPGSTLSDRQIIKYLSTKIRHFSISRVVPNICATRGESDSLLAGRP